MKKFNIGYHFMIMLKGFARVILGAISAGLVGLACYGLVLVPGENGYAAVADFVVAVMLLILAGLLIYLLGCGFPFVGKKHVV